MTRSITISPISPILGAEVHGVDLSEGIDDATFAILHGAFLDHGVLVFREQGAMAPDVQVEFARRLGPLHEHPAAPTDHENPAVSVAPDNCPSRGTDQAPDR